MEYSNYLGKRLDGRYQIMEVIGVGGMAVVYKAYDNIDQRTVAVKILKDEFLANEEFKRRFKNESKAIALLSHENIVRVFDVSYGEALQYIVMEYVDGITLKEYIQQQGKIDPREAIYFITQILRALQHAHDRGIVHRDVKPQNTMLQSDGTIKVTDFGIARFSRGETKTMTDSAIGSVHYFSPEQATGDATDAKTDLYAAGVVLYEMLTGSLPFQSDNAVSVALMQLQKEPALPRELNPDLPIGLEQIIMKAMQKNVSDRYQTASEMLNDIEQFKRNPNIKFNYILASTGADKIEADADVYENVPVAPVRPQRQKVQNKPAAPAPAAVEEEDSESEIDDKTKKRNIILLSGAFIALVAVAALLFSVLGLGGKNKIEVPLLEGLNYYTDIVNNDLYADFNIVPNFRSDSTEPAGKILEQDPKSGKKVDPGSVITVYISGDSTGVEIPASIIGKNFNTAETELKALGFVVEIQTQKSDKHDVGAVISSNPAAGEKAARGSTVVIYVATNKDVQQVEVPSLLGLTVSQAKTALENVGLTLNVSDSEYRNSTVTAGLIIGYEKAGQKVLPGTSIAVYVSNGKAPSESTSASSTSATDSSTSTTASTTASTTTEPYYEEPTYEDGDNGTENPTEQTISIYIPTEDYEPEEDTTYPDEPDTEYEEPEPDTEPDIEPDTTSSGDDIVIEIG